ncbi:MAG: glycosyl transferase [Roseiflexus sp.]|nr:glycosyl transferase [Roseiflexus sp.]
MQIVGAKVATTTMNHSSAPLSNKVLRSWYVRIRAIIGSHVVLLVLLSGQFALVQALTGPQYGDAPRNMHWGILIVENPAFLFGAPDTYERIKGFPPDPPSLAPLALYRFPQGGLHRWWGPVPPLIFACVWALTRSYTALHLVIPLAGAGVVLLTYWLARLWLMRREALMAAAFLACFPLFRDYATVAYSEALSALALTAALLAYVRERTVAAVILGGLAALMKLDLLALYFGSVGIAAAWSFVTQWRRREPVTLSSWVHTLAALIGPALIASPWVWFHYLGQGERAPTGGLSLRQFSLVAPQMLELLFYIPWYGALLTLAVIGALAGIGACSDRFPSNALALLLAWMGLGVVVLLVYAATPGSGNSPRVIIPALPPLALLVAAGFTRLPLPWKRRAAFYLVVLFTLINLVTIGYYAGEGARLRSYEPVWQVLRSQPRGYVLTEAYWPTILYARQPATWFEFDEVFRRNIMENVDHFVRYTSQHPIRYVVLPAHDDTLASPEVRAYLERHARRVEAGKFVVYVVPDKR